MFGELFFSFLMGLWILKWAVLLFVLPLMAVFKGPRGAINAFARSMTERGSGGLPYQTTPNAYLFNQLKVGFVLILGIYFWLFFICGPLFAITTSMVQSIPPQ